MNVPIKIKKLRPEAIIPSYAHKGDAGMDLYSCEDYVLKPGERKVFGTGLSIELPEGYVSLFWDKSGLAAKQGLTVLAGVIEYTYRGEYGVVLLNTSDKEAEIKKGQKIAQLLIQPICTAEVQEVNELTETTRGTSGFGSTGN
jgi:dUTP pyrophosphatase